MLDSWFQKLEKFLKDINLLSAPDLSLRLWNADETGFCTSMASKKFWQGGGQGRFTRRVEEVAGTIHSSYWVQVPRMEPGFHHSFCIRDATYTSAGQVVDQQEQCMSSVTVAGWRLYTNFCQWFEKLYIPAVASLLSTGPVVLFVDGHHSHLTLQLIKVAKSKGVHLFCLPPHVTHIVQPLDIRVYGGVEGDLKRAQAGDIGETVTKEEFPGST